ncbi:MAG: hypothetical protein AAGC55_26220, partial [Myxococcota bacterium]
MRWRRYRTWSVQARARGAGTGVGRAGALLRAWFALQCELMSYRQRLIPAILAAVFGLTAMPAAAAAQ